MYEDEDFIYLRYDNESDSYSYYDELRIILDKKTHDIKETIISTENAKLFIVEKNHKYGVFHKDLGYLLQNKYNWAQIIGNLVYVENDEIGYLLYNGQKLIKEIDKTKDLYNTRYELVSISPYYIGITKGYDPFMIIDIEGNIVLDNIHYYKSYDNIVIIDVNDKLESTKCYWDREDCLAIYSKDFQPLYPDEYMTNIIHCDCGIFIGKNANIHVIYDEYGKKLFSTDEYSIVNKFNDGLSIVCKKGHYGAIDVKGNEIVPCCHSEITDFKDGIATTIKYDEKIEIYSDGTMQSILYGKVIGNVTFHKNIFCQIIDGHLYFTDDQNIHIADYLNNNVHEVIAFIYKDGTYFLLNDLTYSHLTGKVFLVNKTGLIIHWGYSDALFRISSECVLCGIDKLIEQPMSINTIDRIVNGGLKRNCVLITSTGIVSDYISSVNECIHFILQDTMYRVINNTGCTLWENYEMMNISLKPDGSFKLYCFNCYLENDNHDKSQVYIKVWDNSTLESKNIICSSGLIDVSDIIFSLDKNYMVIPIERNRGYYNDRKELHLIVLGEDDEVIIDQNFGDSTDRKSVV